MAGLWGGRWKAGLCALGVSGIGPVTAAVAILSICYPEISDRRIRRKKYRGIEVVD